MKGGYTLHSSLALVYLDSIGQYFIKFMVLEVFFSRTVNAVKMVVNHGFSKFDHQTSLRRYYMLTISLYMYLKT